MSLVSTSPCFCVLCAIFFALPSLMWVRARKGSPRKPKMGKICCFRARWASIFAETPLEGSRRASIFADQQSWDPTGQVVLRRSSGSRARLLAVLTLQCAAKPHWRHGRQPAQATTYRVNVRIKGAHVRRMRSQKQKMGLKGSQASRRSPCLPGDDRGETPKGPTPRCVR